MRPHQSAPRHSGTATELCTTHNATMARITIGSGHTGELLLPGRHAGPIAYVDNDGDPVLFLRSRTPVVAKAVGLRVAGSWPPGTSTLLVGTLAGDTPGSPAELPALLSAHSACLGQLGPLGSGWFRPTVLHVESLVIEQEPTGLPEQAAAAPSALDMAAYRSAAPDLFTALGPQLAHHLTAHHQEVLRPLAPSCPEIDDEADVAHVTVRHLDARGIQIDVLSLAGSTPLELSFPTPVVHPHGFGAALRELAEAS